MLQELLVKKGAVPLYTFTNKTINENRTLFVCNVSYNKFYASGEGNSKKEAKHTAAENMLSLLEANNEVSILADKSSVANIKPKSFEMNEKISSPSCQPSTLVCNYIGMLQELCQQEKINPKEIHYKDLYQDGQDHQKIFTIEVILGSKKATGTGPCKKSAKQEAARKLLMSLNSKVVNSNVNNAIELDRTKLDIFSINTNDLKKKMLESAIRDLGTEILEATDKETSLVVELSEKAKSLYLESFTERYNRGIDQEIDPSQIQNFHILFKSNYFCKIPYDTRKKMQIIQDNCNYQTNLMHEIREEIERLLEVKIRFSICRGEKNHIAFAHLMSKPRVTQVGVGNTETIAKSCAIHNLVKAILIFFSN